MRCLQKPGIVLYSELSYEINGILFKVFKEIGPGYKEKHLQRAVANAFETAGLKFEEQLEAVFKFQGKIIGRYFLDFVVDNKVVVELKVGEYFFKKDYEQVKDYLIKSGLKLGLLVRYGRRGVNIERVLNPKNLS